MDIGMVKSKLKSIKDVYRREAKKVKNSKDTGSSSDDIYCPKVPWFESADVFLRDHVRSRDPVDSMAIIVSKIRFRILLTLVV